MKLQAECKYYLLTVPKDVTDLKVSKSDEHSVVLEWQAPDSNPSYLYKIIICNTTSSCWSSEKINSTRYAISNLLPCFTYTFHVKAVINNAESTGVQIEAKTNSTSEYFDT